MSVSLVCAVWIRSMESLKQELHTREKLEEKIQAKWGDLHGRLREQTFGERIELQKYKNPFLYSAILGVGLLLVMWFIGGSLLLVVLTFIVAVLAAYNGYYWYQAAESYTRKLNTLAYKLAFEVFGLKAKHFDTGSQQKADEDQKVTTALEESELLTERVERLDIGDVFETEFSGKILRVSELHATRTEGSGKHKQTVTVFKGLFVTYQLRTTLSGTTFISTEGDTRGYGHRSFWGAVTGKNAVEETLLESNEFERDLHVATSDGTEARYILTPDLMYDLHEWWKEHERNIRIVCKESECAMLFPDKDVKVSYFTTRQDLSFLKKYTESIIVPIWHVLLLLEEISERFR